MKSNNIITCIRDSFTEEQKILIPNRPSKENNYTIRKILLTRNGKAVLLYEIENPLLKDSITGMMFEPSFNANRFAVIDGTQGEILEEILEKEMYELTPY